MPFPEVRPGDIVIKAGLRTFLDDAFSFAFRWITLVSTSLIHTIGKELEFYGKVY